MIYLAAVCVLISIALFLLAARQRRKSGIPAGRVIFADTNRWGKVEKPLFHPSMRLAGKPDYLVRRGRQVIPVEVKSSRSRQQPAEWHVYQLAAYCLLVEHEFSVRPPYGIIHYPKRDFAVNFTRRLEQSTIETIRSMRANASQQQVDRSHHDQGRCIHCGYRPICDQALRI